MHKKIRNIIATLLAYISCMGAYYTLNATARHAAPRSASAMLQVYFGAFAYVLSWVCVAVLAVQSAIFIAEYRKLRLKR